MDNKFSYAVVGAFVLALGAVLIAGVLWLAAGGTGKKRYEPYQVVFKESVSGLNVNAPVKYLGVDVGKVREIELDPKDPQQVNLTLQIERGTPVKQDTEAVLRTQGLTGIAYVDLSGGSPQSPPLVAPPDGGLPTIRSKPSLTTRIENVLTSVLGNIDRTSVSLNATLDAENRAALFVGHGLGLWIDGQFRRRIDRQRHPVKTRVIHGLLHLDVQRRTALGIGDRIGRLAEIGIGAAAGRGLLRIAQLVFHQPGGRGQKPEVRLRPGR